jgi:ABC-type dipeptide/oligopeptide/nickel transport system permease subunit
MPEPVQITNQALPLPVRSPWGEAWLRLRKNRMAIAGLVCFSAITLLCLLAPWIAPFDPNAQDLLKGPTPPGATHWFGTDTLGRDLASRTLFGGRISIAVGFAATLVAMTIGVAWGAIAGYSGGWLDSMMMRIVDILYSIPFIFVVIFLITFLGEDSVKAWLQARGIEQITIFYLVIGAIYWLTMSRVVRGQVLSLRNEQFVEAARTIGASSARIVFRHLCRMSWVL